MPFVDQGNIKKYLRLNSTLYKQLQFYETIHVSVEWRTRHAAQGNNTSTTIQNCTSHTQWYFWFGASEFQISSTFSSVVQNNSVFTDPIIHLLKKKSKIYKIKHFGLPLYLSLVTTWQHLYCWTQNACYWLIGPYLTNITNSDWFHTGAGVDASHLLPWRWMVSQRSSTSQLSEHRRVHVVPYRQAFMFTFTLDDLTTDTFEEGAVNISSSLFEHWIQT